MAPDGNKNGDYEELFVGEALRSKPWNVGYSCAGRKGHSNDYLFGSRVRLNDVVFRGAALRKGVKCTLCGNVVKNNVRAQSSCL